MAELTEDAKRSRIELNTVRLYTASKFQDVDRLTSGGMW
jgi:hypothetical protein